MLESNLAARVGAAVASPAEFLAGIPVQLRKQRVPLVGVPHDPCEAALGTPVFWIRFLHFSVLEK